MANTFLKTEDDLRLFSEFGKRRGEVFLLKSLLKCRALVKVGSVSRDLEDSYFERLSALVVGGGGCGGDGSTGDEESITARYFALQALVAAFDSSASFLERFKNEKTFFLHIFDSALVRA